MSSHRGVGDDSSSALLRLQQEQARAEAAEAAAAARKALQAMRVAQGELGSLKPERHVYEQKGGLWFLTSQQQATEHLKARVHKAEKEQAQTAAKGSAAAVVR
jgi:chaperonin cofactor prefoldin